MKSLKSIRKRKAFTTANEQFEELKKLRGKLEKAKKHYRTELTNYREADRKLNDAYAGGNTSEISELRELRDKAKKKLNDRQNMIENTGSDIDELESEFGESLAEVRDILTAAVNERIKPLADAVNQVEQLDYELHTLQRLGALSQSRQAITDVPTVLNTPMEQALNGSVVETPTGKPNRKMSQRLNRTKDVWNTTTK